MIEKQPIRTASLRVAILGLIVAVLVGLAMYKLASDNEKFLKKQQQDNQKFHTDHNSILLLDNQSLKQMFRYLGSIYRLQRTEKTDNEKLKASRELDKEFEKIIL